MWRMGQEWQNQLCLSRMTSPNVTQTGMDFLCGAWTCLCVTNLTQTWHTNLNLNFLWRMGFLCGVWIHTPHIWLPKHVCGVWIHTPQTCLGSHMCGVWIHTPQRKPMRHKKFKFKFVCHVCVKFVTHKHVHAPQRKSIPVCVTFGEVIRDKQSWFCHSCPMRHIPHVTSLLFSCSGKITRKSLKDQLLN